MRNPRLRCSPPASLLALGRDVIGRHNGVGRRGVFRFLVAVRCGTLACGARLRLRSSLWDATSLGGTTALGVVGFLGFSSRSDAEPSLAVLASGFAPRFGTRRHWAAQRRWASWGF